MCLSYVTKILRTRKPRQCYKIVCVQRYNLSRLYSILRHSVLKYGYNKDMKYENLVSSNKPFIPYPCGFHTYKDFGDAVEYFRLHVRPFDVKYFKILPCVIPPGPITIGKEGHLTVYVSKELFIGMTLVDYERHTRVQKLKCGNDAEL